MAVKSYNIMILLNKKVICSKQGEMKKARQDHRNDKMAPRSADDRQVDPRVLRAGPALTVFLPPRDYTLFRLRLWGSGSCLGPRNARRCGYRPLFGRIIRAGTYSQGVKKGGGSMKIY
jgi:hypothetical protein